MDPIYLVYIVGELSIVILLQYTDNIIITMILNLMYLLVAQS